MCDQCAINERLIEIEPQYMKLLEAALHPMPLSELRTHYEQGRCLVLEGDRNKFEGLVSPLDIERRLNDGCNANAFAQVIKSGSRVAELNSQCGWTPAALCKSEFTKAVQSGNSFMMPNSSQITSGIARLCTELEAFFVSDHVCADVHLYVSTSASGNSYNAHRDLPQHKILLQAHGDANWQIFSAKKEIPETLRALTDEQQDEYLELESEFTLSQGDLLYMPPGTFHRVVSVAGSRISISIPFFSIPQVHTMDRSHIPFAQLFASADKPTPIDLDKATT